jgi:hypothetical protein
MPLSSILLIVVRLQSVMLVFHSLSWLSVALTNMVQYPLSQKAMALTVPMGGVLLAVILWFVAPLLVGAILEERDGVVSVGSLRLQDLYCFGFFFLGLYFVLSSLAPALTWAHYTFGMAATSAPGDFEVKRSMYQLLDPVITVAAGFACVLNGSQWAEKLVRRNYRTEPGAPPTSRPPSPLPTSPEMQSSDSLRTPPTGGCG